MQTDDAQRVCLLDWCPARLGGMCSPGSPVGQLLGGKERRTHTGNLSAAPRLLTFLVECPPLGTRKVPKLQNESLLPEEKRLL